MQEWFWAFAYRHYHGKNLGRLIEAAVMTWGVFFVLVYMSAVVGGWIPNLADAVLGIFLSITPIFVGLAHRRIRIEAAKGNDALYRKLLAVRQQKKI